MAPLYGPSVLRRLFVLDETGKNLEGESEGTYIHTPVCHCTHMLHHHVLGNASVLHFADAVAGYGSRGTGCPQCLRVGAQAAGRTGLLTEQSSRTGSVARVACAGQKNFETDPQTTDSRPEFAGGLSTPQPSESRFASFRSLLPIRCNTWTATSLLDVRFRKVLMCIHVCMFMNAN